MTAVLGPELLRALYDEHAGALWAYATRLTGGDQVRAQDVVQETLLRAWRHPEVLDTSRGSVRSWLFTVARRLVIDEWRSARRRHEVVTDEVPEPVGDDHLSEQVVDRHLVAAAMQQLSAQHREVLYECYYRGASVSQAAQTLNISPGTVKSRTHYALRALRAAMDELGGVR